MVEKKTIRFTLVTVVVRRLVEKVEQVVARIDAAR